MKNKIIYNMHENIAKNLIFVDGITRSGKGMFAGIIPSLENVEHYAVFNLIEQVLPALRFGAIDQDFAKALLRTQFNETAYKSMLARNINFRYDDETGIFNFKDPAVYFKRLARKDGDDVCGELRQGKIYFPFKTHDMLVNIDILEKLEIDYYIIELFRNPVDIVHSWWKRGWGERYGRDPRAFSLSIDYKGHKMPWYAAGFEREWISLSAKERCIRTVSHLVDRSVESYRKAKNRKRIHIVTFEDFVTEPFRELDRISEFLGTKTTEYTQHMVRKARCPRELSGDEREKKLKDMRAGTGKKYFEMLAALALSYDKDVYGLKR